MLKNSLFPLVNEPYTYWLSEVWGDGKTPAEQKITSSVSVFLDDLPSLGDLGSKDFHLERIAYFCEGVGWLEDKPKDSFNLKECGCGCGQTRIICFFCNKATSFKGERSKGAGKMRPACEDCFDRLENLD